MTRHVDLDALAAQRAEGRGEAPTVAFKGETFELPVEMPVAVVEAWVNDSDAFVFGAAIFGAEWDRFRALNPSRDDIWALGARMNELWGVSEGESRASGGSSGSDATSSRPTSNGSTASTSGDPSGDQSRSAPADSPS